MSEGLTCREHAKRNRKVNTRRLYVQQESMTRVAEEPRNAPSKIMYSKQVNGRVPLGGRYMRGGEVVSTWPGREILQDVPVLSVSTASRRLSFLNPTFVVILAFKAFTLLQTESGEDLVWRS